MDDDRTIVLGHRIETLRRYLAEGVMAEIAALYLQEIARAEAELALIASPSRRRSHERETAIAIDAG